MRVLLVHKDCPGCEEAKEKFNRENPKGIALDISIAEVKPIAKKIIEKNGIKAVPWLVEVEDKETIHQLETLSKLRLGDSV